MGEGVSAHTGISLHKLKRQEGEKNVKIDAHNSQRCVYRVTPPFIKMISLTKTRADQMIHERLLPAYNVRVITFDKDWIRKSSTEHVKVI